MSSGPNRVPFVNRQKLIAPAEVLIIWALQLLFLIIFLTVVRSSFQVRIVEDLEQHLKQFISSNHSRFSMAPILPLSRR